MPAWLKASQAGVLLAVDPSDGVAMVAASEPPAIEAYRISRAVDTPLEGSPQLIVPM